MHATPALLTGFYHPRAIRDYRDSSGQVLACALMAGAFCLLTGGQARVVRPVAGSNRPLRPRVAAGLTWGAHVVCVHEGRVYDAPLPEPCPEATYLERAFWNPDDLRLDRETIAIRSDFYLRAIA